MPVVPIVARNGKGILELMAEAVEVAKGKKTPMSRGAGGGHPLYQIVLKTLEIHM